MSKIELEWNQTPDACGFLDGEVRQGDHVMPFKILPPTRLWRGQTMPDGCEPFPDHWQIFVDNLQIAVEGPEGLGKTLMSLLGEHRQAQEAGQRLASRLKK